MREQRPDQGGLSRGPTAEEAIEIIRRAARENAETARAIQREEEPQRWLHTYEPTSDDELPEDDPNSCDDS